MESETVGLECGSGFDTGDSGTYYFSKPGLSAEKLCRSFALIRWCTWLHLVFVLLLVVLRIFSDNAVGVLGFSGYRYFEIGVSGLSFGLVLYALFVLFRVKLFGFRVSGLTQRYIPFGILVSLNMLVSGMVV